jgi:hypothetical protein
MALIPRKSYTSNAIIAESGTTSAAIDLDENDLVAIITPDALTGTAVSIVASNSINGAFVTVQDGDGADLSIAIAANKFIPISNLALTAGLRFIKLVSNGTEAAERTFILVQRRTS